MLSQEVASSLQGAPNKFCLAVTGVGAVPTVLFVLVPIIIWFGERALATLWGELVKHVTRPAAWYDELRKVKLELAAARAAMLSRRAQESIEQDLIERLLHENDRLLAILLVRNIIDQRASPKEGALDSLTIIATREAIRARRVDKIE